MSDRDSWKVHSRHEVLHSGNFLRVEMHDVELPSGRRIPDWPYVITPDYINVVVVTPACEFVCFRQTKYAIDGSSLALVGGYIEPGEEPIQAARREMLEETGYSASDWVHLGSYVVDANRGCGTAHLFLAQNAARVCDANADDLEEQEMVLLSREQVAQALRLHEFKVLAWSGIIALALHHLDA